MIHLTRINHKALIVNSDLIEHVESTPDTVISMTTGQKFMVLESAGEIVEKVIAFRQAVCAGLVPCAAASSGGRPLSTPVLARKEAGGDDEY